MAKQTTKNAAFDFYIELTHNEGFFWIAQFDKSDDNCRFHDVGKHIISLLPALDKDLRLRKSGYDNLFMSSLVR